MLLNIASSFPSDDGLDDENFGFADVFHMTEWLLATHGESFTGTVIAWDWKPYLPAEGKTFLRGLAKTKKPG